MTKPTSLPKSPSFPTPRIQDITNTIFGIVITRFACHTTSTSLEREKIIGDYDSDLLVEFNKETRLENR